MIYMNIGVKINFVVPIKIQRGTNENTNNITTSISVRLTKYYDRNHRANIRKSFQIFVDILL